MTYRETKDSDTRPSPSMRSERDTERHGQTDEIESLGGRIVADAIDS